MIADRSARRGRMRRVFGAFALAAALCLTSVQAASAAIVNRSWQAKIGAGTATISAYVGGAGVLALKLSGLRASTTYATNIHGGTCSSVGPRLLTLASFTTTSAGAATRSIGLSALEVASITAATSGGGTISIRVGSAARTRCGQFVVQPVVAARISVGELALSLAADGTAVWVVNWGNDSVSRIDPATNAVVATIPVTRNPDSIASDGTGVWVTGWTDNVVSRIDPATNTVVATVQVGMAPAGIAIGGGSVWVANSGSASVSRIDPATNMVTATMSVGVGPVCIAFGEGSVWVANWGDGTVSRIDPATNAVVATIPVGMVDSVAAGGGSVWITVWGYPDDKMGSVARIDPLTNAVALQLMVGFRPTGLAINGDSLYVALQGEPTVVQVRGGNVAARIDVGMKSHRLAFANDSMWVLHPIGSGIGGGPLLAGGVSRVNL